jgi:anti-anti-sigma regulatory factor
MTLRIEKSVRQGSAVFSLVGRFEAEHIKELEGLLGVQNGARLVVLDLQEVRLVDREAVQFLARCEAAGVQLENCPAYIRQWVGKEKP